MVISALKEFNSATRSGSRLSPEANQECATDVRAYYQSEFLPRLDAVTAADVPQADLVPTEVTSLGLQCNYIARNDFPVGSKHLMDAASATSSYDSVHRRYHPVLRSYQSRFGYYDIFLIDAESGRIVYSVFKEVDFATSLFHGPFRDSNLAEAVKEAMESGNSEFTALVDYEPYLPSYNGYASFVASPIFDGDELIGVLAMQMPIDQIDRMMTNDRRWSEIGLGRSGESYLIGHDFTLRNQSRFFLEDSDAFLDQMRASGAPETAIRSIARLESTIGRLTVKTSGSERAVAGVSGKDIIEDYRGVRVLSAFKELQISGLDWAIMSEIDEEEALAPIVRLRNTMTLAVLLIVLISAFLSVLFARGLTTPIGELASAAESVASGDLDVSIDVRREDEIGRLAKSFQTMRDSVKSMMDYQDAVIQALSVPVIPMGDAIAAVPLVGDLSVKRVTRIRSDLLDDLQSVNARWVIIDITGVPFMDVDTFAELLRIVRSIKLMGGQSVITGLQPEMAMEIAQSNLSIQDLTLTATFTEGLEAVKQKRDSQ
jgi:anti-anti-sigma regulatory factor/HAMP domain-containing protein